MTYVVAINGSHRRGMGETAKVLAPFLQGMEDLRSRYNRMNQRAMERGGG